MFVLSACANATLDRVPRSALQVLRGGAEHIVRADDSGIEIRPEVDLWPWQPALAHIHRCAITDEVIEPQR